MVYKLTRMTLKVKVIFFILIWIFSAICAIFGTVLIATAVILPQTPYKIRPNPIIGEIRTEMGTFKQWNYVHPELGFFENINLNPTEDGVIRASKSDGSTIRDLSIIFLEEVHQNGIVFYSVDLELLVLDLFNGTFFEIKATPEEIGVDANGRTLKLRYNKEKDFTITKRAFNPFGNELEEEKIGEYFVVETRGIAEWFSQIAVTIWNNFVKEFTFIARTLLSTVAIGGGIGIGIAFILIITRIAKLFGGKFWTYRLLKALNGRLGRIVTKIPFFDFDGDFFIEERFVDIIDLSTVRSSLSELYKQRWYDILFFPTALASILTVIFVQNFPGGDKIVALTLSPLLSPIVLLILLIYYPIIWTYNEAGVKRMKISPQGDIVAVKPLGKILRDGLGIIIGFSGILSLGALAVEITQGIALIPSSTGQIEVAGFTFDVFGLLVLAFWTIGLFFLLLGSIIVGASLLAINHLLSSHLGTIKNLRTKAEKEGIITNWGSVSYQFSPKAKPTIYVKEREE
ncbi:MAG: hypothetical protein ACXACU_09525 [Candidatus Hodarchaeales archaeon]